MGPTSDFLFEDIRKKNIPINSFKSYIMKENEKDKAKKAMLCEGFTNEG